MKHQICTTCIYDSTTPAIEFDEQGVCNYCKLTDRLRKENQTGTEAGEKRINEIILEIKRKGIGKPYDCIVGVSGGTDSSFLIDWAVKQGLRPLAVHYDNTWNTAIATENIRKVLTKLEVDLFTLVVNNKEVDDIFRSFFLAGVPELDASTDLALAETMYRAASKYRVEYILEGHSFVAEGVTPLGKNYFDGKYIASIHKKYGKVAMKTYPLMSFSQFMKWTVFKRIKKIRPLWYIQYDKASAQKVLEDEFGWEYYGGHHLENRMTAFNHSFYFPKKFNIDYRNNTLSAAVRSGHLSRDEAIDLYYNHPPYLEPELINYFKKRLGFTDAEFDLIMSQPAHYWYEFPTYKKLFEALRPMFYLLKKANLVTESFYIKYCFPSVHAK